MNYNCLNICRYSDFSRSSWVVYETCMRLRRCPVSRQLTNKTLAAQAIVASRVQKTYNYTSEQIEACVLANHEKLSQVPSCVHKKLYDIVFSDDRSGL